MNKYQFHISFNNKLNTAASKAVQDCKSILSEAGYADYSIDDIRLTDSWFRLKLLFRAFNFFLTLKTGAVVAVQYPLTSGNKFFRLFIKAARLRGVKFFCIVHDLEDLRFQTADDDKPGNDIQLLNDYDYVIVHNEVMQGWLKKNGLITPMIILHAFDYLAILNTPHNENDNPANLNTIAFAGNLSKSKFVYALNIIDKWSFNLYGPNYLPERASLVKNICWHGTLSPDELLTNIKGAFGLVWDGDYIDRLDTGFGNYLKFNYPHKLSLYLAAGLPVIAPRASAISGFIIEHRIGILFDNLTDLQGLDISDENYRQLKDNVSAISPKLRAGKYFSTAVAAVETALITENYQTKTAFN
jgi:glycosyltransferase involved in cell wall biosynthesis